MRENQTVTAEVNHLAAEKRQLQDMSKRLAFSLTNAEQANLSEADAARVLEIQQQLGVTPRGSIKAQNVREVRLYKDQQTTRLGIIFHQVSERVSQRASMWTAQWVGLPWHEVAGHNMRLQGCHGTRLQGCHGTRLQGCHGMKLQPLAHGTHSTASPSPNPSRNPSH